MDCLQPCSVKIGSRLVLHPLSSTGHLSIHCQKLKSCSSQQIRKPTVLSSNRPRLWMAKQVALTECGNLMHMCAASSSHSTRCASNAAPAQHNSGTLKSEAQAMELKAGSQADTVPHRRQGVPVYVMLPLDTVNSQGQFQYASTSWFARALGLLQASGVEGVAVDVWWGAVERQPGKYDWSGYRELFKMVKAKGLRIQAVMSFHACGGNVGDYAQVPLPEWVLKCGKEDPTLFCTDRPRHGQPGTCNDEYISLFADQASVLQGRTPLECYADYMHAFREAFIDDIGAAIHEIAVGGGPCGELRYPSYVETQGWRFPGAGEFQCYDQRALASLAEAAAAVEQPEWGKEGPHDAGEYNSWPEDTGFFRGWGGAWDSPYGRFFMKWYSDNLLLHGERLCKTASSIFNTSRPKRCTPKYSSSHHNSPLNPMSVLSDLTSVLRGSTEPTPTPQGTPQVQQYGLPSEQTPAVQSELMKAEPVSNRHAQHLATNPREPMTPTHGGQLGPAPLPTSWPTAHTTSSQPTCQLDNGTSTQHHEQQAPASDAGSPNGSSHPMVPRRDGSPQANCSSSAVAEEGLTDTEHSTQHGAHRGSRTPPAGGRPQSVHATGQTDSLQVNPPGEGVSVTADRAAAPEASTAEQAQARSQWQPAGRAVEVSLKIAGVHWWYNSRSHAAEMTAGYYNTEVHDGYAGMLEMCAQHGMVVTLTCVEMCDAQHPPEAVCGPEGLLRQVREGAAAAGVLLGGENALPCFVPGGVDQYALDRIVYNTKPWSPPLQMDTMANQMPHNMGQPEGHVTEDPGLSAAFWQERYGDSAVGPVRTLPVMRSFTFLRLIPDMMSPEYQSIWFRFMQQMQQTQDTE